MLMSVASMIPPVRAAKNLIRALLGGQSLTRLALRQRGRPAYNRRTCPTWAGPRGSRGELGGGASRCRQALRLGGGAGRRRPRDPEGRVLLAAGPQRLRQDHDPQP